MATDEVVEGLWYVARLLGEDEERRAVRELGLLLPGATGPYAGAAAFRTSAGPDGAPLATRVRASCRMFCTVRPEDMCATCPRTRDGARIGKAASAAAA